MKSCIIASLVTVLGSVMAAFGAVAQASEDSSALMLRAAEEFVASLGVEQRETCLFPFEQTLWESWHFIPMRNRAGLPFGAMTAEQRHLADVLIASGMSRPGFQKTKVTMSLEQVLFDLETAAGANPFTELRNPDSYYFALYGTPSTEGEWAWRVEGHHVSLHFAMQNGRIITSTPMFFGANPHEVLEGPRKGLRSLGREEDLARALLESLDEEQRKAALVSGDVPQDILTRNKSVVDWGSVPKEGLQRSKMTDAQKDMLQALLNEYIFNVPRDLAERRLKVIEESGDEIYFVWMGASASGVGNPHYYRVHGKTFLIEYDNIQNEANHSHTVWRDYENDFGRDVLAEHYRTAHRSD
ncbi:MAG: DUF3500 domain-containing protein [Candidatus Hydrogenedentes bacterium]|nr:DUF3500 domain-containing protein [Candidatus Hydrogenedentota bacterium]